jgi:hypothetical protein
MKLSKIIGLIIIFLTFSTHLGMVINLSSAEDENYNISIADMTYTFVKTEGIRGREFDYYNVVITLTNSGNVVSDDITVEIIGEDGLPEKRNQIIPANGENNYIFSNFYLEKSPEHKINVSYYPSGLTVHERNEYNSGIDSFIISTASNNSESTPGFELLLFLIAFLVYLVIRKRR